MRAALALLFVVTSSIAACSGGGGDLPTGDAGGGNGGAADAGGGGGQTDQLLARDFDRSCQTAEDCAMVIEGRICQVCGCPNAAIARSALDAFNAKRAAASCPKPDVACTPCEPPAPLGCVENLCTLVEN